MLPGIFINLFPERTNCWGTFIPDVTAPSLGLGTSAEQKALTKEQSGVWIISFSLLPSPLGRKFLYPIMPPWAQGTEISETMHKIDRPSLYIALSLYHHSHAKVRSQTDRRHSEILRLGATWSLLCSAPMTVDLMRSKEFFSFVAEVCGNIDTRDKGETVIVKLVSGREAGPPQGF